MRTAFRQTTLTALAAEPVDLLVIGGGIVGAGVARDAAMRGLKVALVDQYDFASGTSSRSSRLLHGGIRYLAQGRLGLVRQASVEKRILHEIAPHLAEPLAFIFPSYRNSSWPLWQLRIGVKLYDLLCGGKNFGRSQYLSFKEAATQVPGLRRAELAGAVRYFDALTQDARLVIDTLRSAHRNGARLANYVRFESAERQGTAFVCQAKDLERGEPFDIRARCIVNASGPWAQGLSLSEVRLRLTKGVHLVFERSRLPVPDAVVLTEGARVLFVIPWGDRVIVGTTDTDYDGRIEAARTEPKDVE